MRVVVIVPTYNERENIAALIPALQSEFQNLAHESHILVVDDLSPDGTADVVRALQEEHHNVHLLTGEKRGLGAAYIRGMRYAIEALGADVVFEMDADFSHKPADVPRLMATLESGADFVIGSRYVEERFHSFGMGASPAAELTCRQFRRPLRGGDLHGAGLHRRLPRDPDIAAEHHSPL